MITPEDEMLADQERLPHWEDGKWRTGGLIAYFSEAYLGLRQIIPTLPPYLPPHLIDPVQIAQFLGLNLDEFDWKGPETSQILASIRRVEGQLGIGSVRKAIFDAPAQMLTTKEVSILLGCSYSEAREKMLDGRIKSVKDGRWLRSRKEWVEEYVAEKLVKAATTTPEIHSVRVRKPRKGQVSFTKGGMGYQFLKERQQNQK